MKKRFTKILLGEDMSGGGKGVCPALAISNAITNLPAEGYNLDEGICKLRWEDCEEQIDLTALVSKEPILFYDEVIFYEDELADSGVLLLTVKVISEKVKPHPVLISMLTTVEDIIPKWKIVPTKDVIEISFKDPAKREEGKKKTYKRKLHVYKKGNARMVESRRK
ncbi:hypothetical protein AgCh_007631 [Apium graveolens]